LNTKYIVEGYILHSTY